MNLKESQEFCEDLKNALDVLKKGGIILYPTDTIWGIGCDARNSEAVRRIFRLKKREDSKSMLVLIDEEEALKMIVEDVPVISHQLLKRATEPLTLIYDGAKNIAPELIAPDGSIGIRITRDNFSNELCKRLNAPLVSTSANISGDKSPGSFDEISQEIKSGVDYIVKYRQQDKTEKKPSRIIKLGKEGIVKIIR